MESSVISAEGNSCIFCSEDVVQSSSPISEVEALIEDWGFTEGGSCCEQPEGEENEN